MKKLFLVCLMMLAGSAWADWVKFDENEQMQFFYDPATIRKDGNIRRVWRLQNFKQLGDEGEMSRRFRIEYDCKNERDNILSFSGHSELMASGTTLYSHNDTGGKWRDIPPRSSAATILAIVCSK